MCLAVPGRVSEIKGKKAIVDYGGIKRTADISLVDVKEGDYVIVHAGFAIQVLNKKDAEETLKIFEEFFENA
ncbi:MAG TPA: HypC/HybG/HupF family hydrogenase formation chaperone [Thermoplasmatales archaeon]|nr:HypC/HybG/HupF family hydrogenase formation chaperone [Thermoplasmatales archaeon]